MQSLVAQSFPGSEPCGLHGEQLCAVLGESGLSLVVCGPLLLSSGKKGLLGFVAGVEFSTLAGL